MFKKVNNPEHIRVKNQTSRGDKMIFEVKNTLDEINRLKFTKYLFCRLGTTE